MNYATLMSPGLVNGGFRLRLDCAKAISAVELVSKTGPGGIATALNLRDFFIDCANRADIAAGGTGSDVSAGGITLSPSQAVITDGIAVVAPITGTGTEAVTPTIVDGVVTGIALS